MNLAVGVVFWNWVFGFCCQKPLLFRDVGSNRNKNKKGESMGDGCNDESSAYVGSTVFDLSEGHAGPFMGEDNNKGGNELSQGFL